MTRINTNVSSLTAQKTLARSNAQLEQALTRLSTGLRINVGKDDPAGLIASEALRADITSVGRAITNSQRANQVIATADSALGQVNSLLNDIRGLVTEAANSGAMSDDQIAANQVQIDSSLEALNRISQTTSFQGRRLLDGSLDFTYTALAGALDDVTDLQIDQANLGTTGTMDVSVNITAAAAQAKITTDIPDSVAATKASYEWDLSGGDQLTITADSTGETYNDVTVEIHESASVASGEAVAFFNGTDKLDIYLTDTALAETTFAKIIAAVNATSFTATDTGAGDSKYLQGTDTAGVKGDTAGGADLVTGLAADTVFQLNGSKGAQVFSFDTGTTGDQIADAIEGVKDATGVSAAFNGVTGVLTLSSTDYGADALVAVDIISGALGTGISATRATGTDIAATVNGYVASGKGNTLSINTASLVMSASVADGTGTDFDLQITGGGALFQLGPDVVTNQQARFGIGSVNAASLGGSAGRLYELGSGNGAALATDPGTAGEIVDQVIDKVTSLRGRLGAFQKTTLDSNIASLSDTLENLAAAESSIRDADFAAESAKLTRAQILVQSGMSVLAIANRSPQDVLALLR